MISKKASLGLILLGVFYANFACGQTYKCRNADGRFTYSDSPCTVGTKTEKVISFTASSPVTVPSQNGAASTPDSSSTHQRNLRYLDMKIDEAISAGDLRQAKQLAMTPEHWKKIKDAEGMVIPPEMSAHTIEKPSIVQQTQTNPQQDQRQQQTLQFQPVVQQPAMAQTRNQQNVEQAQQRQQQAVMQAQQRQQQAVIQAQQQQQNEMQAYRQQQQQESQRLGQELNSYMQSPSVTKMIEGAGTSGASMQNLLINNKINQLNQTAGKGVVIQPPVQRK